MKEVGWQEGSQLPRILQLEEPPAPLAVSAAAAPMIVDSFARFANAVMDAKLQPINLRMPDPDMTDWSDKEKALFQQMQGADQAAASPPAFIKPCIGDAVDMEAPDVTGWTFSDYTEFTAAIATTMLIDLVDPITKERLYWPFGPPNNEIFRAVPHTLLVRSFYLDFVNEPCGLNQLQSRTHFIRGTAGVGKTWFLRLVFFVAVQLNKLACLPEKRPILVESVHLQSCKNVLFTWNGSTGSYDVKLDVETHGLGAPLVYLCDSMNPSPMQGFVLHVASPFAKHDTNEMGKTDPCKWMFKRFTGGEILLLNQMCHRNLTLVRQQHEKRMRGKPAESHERMTADMNKELATMARPLTYPQYRRLFHVVGYAPRHYFSSDSFEQVLSKRVSTVTEAAEKMSTSDFASRLDALRSGQPVASGANGVELSNSLAHYGLKAGRVPSMSSESYQVCVASDFALETLLFKAFEADWTKQAELLALLRTMSESFELLHFESLVRLACRRRMLDKLDIQYMEITETSESGRAGRTPTRAGDWYTSDQLKAMTAQQLAKQVVRLVNRADDAPAVFLNYARFEHLPGNFKWEEVRLSAQKEGSCLYFPETGNFGGIDLFDNRGNMFQITCNKKGHDIQLYPTAARGGVLVVMLQMGWPHGNVINIVPRFKDEDARIAYTGASKFPLKLGAHKTGKFVPALTELQKSRGMSEGIRQGNALVTISLATVVASDAALNIRPMGCDPEHGPIRSPAAGLADLAAAASAPPPAAAASAPPATASAFASVPTAAAAAAASLRR